MKHTFLIIAASVILLPMCSHIHAQSLERQVIGTSGGFQTASWGTLSSTIGETMTITMLTSSLILTQGFQQSLQSDLAVNEISSSTPAIQIYPNPAVNRINVAINSSNAVKYTVALIDLLGQKLMVPFNVNNTSKGTESFVFDLRPLAIASYFIVVSDETGSMTNTFKFTKIN